MPRDGAAIIPLFGRDFTSKSPTVTSQLLANMYREPYSDADKAPMVLYQTPGLILPDNFGTSADGSFEGSGFLGGITNAMPCRGARTVASTTWLVFGPYVITAQGDFSGILLTTTSGRVSLSDNGNQLIIVDGAFGYTIALNLVTGGPLGSADIIVIADVDFPDGATTVAFLNGYFIVDAPNASRPGQFNWSTQYDGTAWSALDFANAESSPDPLLHVVANFGQLFLFGTLTTEVWAPSGDAAIFRRVGGAGVEWGLAAKWSVDKYANNSLVFLARNRLGQFQPVRMDGYNVVPLGVDGIDPEIVNSMNQLDPFSASGYAYSLDAHSFYQVNFPSRSYLYDDLTQSWSELISGGGRHYGEIRFEIGTVPYVSDYRKPSIYQVSPTAYLDGADPIIRTIISKHVFVNYDRVSIGELYVDCEVGTADVPGSTPLRAPQIMLEWSKDGGRTWGNIVPQSLGLIGEYSTRVRWQNLGIARDWVFRFSFSDENKLVITNAAVRVS